jgi:N-acetylmuramic acid 6-phosphate etherase
MSDRLPPTEERAAQSTGLERLDSVALVDLLARDQAAAAQAVYAQSATIARVVDAIAERMQRGGSLHYVGAGTSGRLGVLDASEMPPTFGTPPELVQGHIAGGDAALRRAIEGAEDDGAAGTALIRERAGANDVVIGISASGGARYVIAALEEARARGAFTAAVTNNPNAALAAAADETIVLATGAEALTGSTRLKAGTAQKIALNTISTAVMVRLGKVYDNLMIDVVATNEKLRDRAIRLVQTLTDLDARDARAALEAAGWSVRAAVERLRSRS